MKNKTSRFTIFATIILIFVAIFIIVEPGLARPGGGHSYSSGSSGGGGGGGDLIGLLIYLIFSLLPPYISIPLIIALYVGYRIYEKKNREGQNQIVSTPTATIKANQSATVSRLLHTLKAEDENFSRVLFIDFVSSLYVKFQAYKYSPQKLKTISPFINKKILKSFEVKAGAAEISEIVVGSVDITDIIFGDKTTRIIVQINANYTSTIAGKSTRYIVKEKWMLERDSTIKSPEPEKMQKLSCPACGAPANFTDTGVCEHCGTMIVPGKMQWYVVSRSVVYSEIIKANALLSYAPETGTNLPTIYSPTIQAEMQQFAIAHNLDWQQYWSVFYHKIASKYFSEIYEKWSTLQWKDVRHLLTDRLWESYNFWIDEYKRHGLRNELKDLQILKMHLAKIEIDKYYEALTIRIFASVKDYVVDKSGKVLAGNPKTPRVFSEYWTFIRRTGVENDDYDMKSCPNCGAPLEKIGQNGVCEYCGAKITTGQFSWVVAIITQDEEYIG